MNDTIETRWEQQNEAGRLSFTDGDYARAEQSFLAAIREATQLGADNVRLASSLSNLGQLKYKQKDFAQAEALFHRALAIRERVLGPEHFGLVRHEFGQQPRQADRFGAQVFAYEVVAGRRGIPLVEHEIDHRQHRAQAIG